MATDPKTPTKQANKNFNPLIIGAVALLIGGLIGYLVGGNQVRLSEKKDCDARVNVVQSRTNENQANKAASQESLVVSIGTVKGFKDTDKMTLEVSEPVANSQGVVTGEKKVVKDFIVTDDTVLMNMTDNTVIRKNNFKTIPVDSTITVKYSENLETREAKIVDGEFSTK